MRHRNFLLLLLGTALLAAATLHVFNVFEGRRPAADRYVLERKLAEAMRTQHATVPPPGINECALRWHTASLIKKPNDIALLGSSHGLLISSDLLGNASLMNYSISGATLPDHLITTSLLRERGMYPRIWVIIVDAWLFDPNTDFGSWHPRANRLAKIEEELAEAGKPLLTPVFSPRHRAPSSTSWTVPFSLDPLVARLDELMKEWFVSVHVIPSADNSPHFALGPDGSFHVPQETNRDNLAGARALALRQFSTNSDRHRYGNFNRIDPELWQFFVRWLELCSKDGAEVWLLLPPYHPAIHPKIIAHPKNQLRRVEQRCRELAKQKGYLVFGSYAPKPAGVGESHFSDGDHLTRAGLQCLLAPMARELEKKSLPASTP